MGKLKLKLPLLLRPRLKLIPGMDTMVDTMVDTTVDTTATPTTESMARGLLKLKPKLPLRLRPRLKLIPGMDTTVDMVLDTMVDTTVDTMATPTEATTESMASKEGYIQFRADEHEVPSFLTTTCLMFSTEEKNQNVQNTTSSFPPNPAFKHLYILDFGIYVYLLRPLEPQERTRNVWF